MNLADDYAMYYICVCYDIHLADKASYMRWEVYWIPARFRESTPFYQLNNQREGNTWAHGTSS